MKNKTMKKINLFLCFGLILETFVIKILQYKIFPAKYFYDSEKILAIMNGSKLTDKSYSFTANFYNKINFLSFYDIKQWSISISIIFLIIFIIIFSRKKLNITKCIFIISTYALLNIYVFNLSKDCIQLCFFLVIYYVYSLPKLKNNKKIVISTMILCFEALFFRTYYLIIGALTIGLYYIYIKFLINTKNNKKKTTTIILASFILFMCMIYILQRASSENYMILINARNSSNIYRDGTDAVTMINDYLENTNYFNFVLNYIINTFRILFPVELLFKGIKYIPFIIFQIFFSITVLKNAIKIREEKCTYLFIVMAFLMVSIIYEPDFGSVIRHESVLILFVLELIKNKGSIENEKSISYNSNL